MAVRPARLALLLLVAGATVHASSLPAVDAATVENAWQRYLENEASLKPEYRFPHAPCFRRSAAAYGLPETLLLAVARGESDFDAGARSRANAHGIMQIQWPGTARHLGIRRLSALYDPCTNIDAGARYLKELLARYDGNLHLALAAYNYGPGRIPPGASVIPRGAAWYSDYIYRHLDYVLGDRRVGPVAPGLYSELGRSVLLSFGEPYRAAAFVERIEQLGKDGQPLLEVDWFRKDVGRFEVVFTYAGKEEFEAGARVLARAGFALQ
jgi:hypothetical protein